MIRRKRQCSVSVLLVATLALVCLLVSSSPVRRTTSRSLRSDLQEDRQLFTLATRQCSLSTRVVLFRYNATSGLYREIRLNETTSPSISNNNNDRQLQIDNGLTQVDGAVEEMRACWCAEVFFRRPTEYCPSSFDTCLVQGTTGPVSCYHTSGANSFVRSFWPVLMFWLVALLYALFCSEPGGSAIDYVRRKLAAVVSNAAQRDERMQQDLQRLLSRQPERAAFLYRQAILRARNRRYAQRRRRSLLFWRRNREDDHAEETDEYNLYLQTQYDTLALSLRVFHNDDGDDNENPQPPSSRSITSDAALQRQPSSSPSLLRSGSSRTNLPGEGGWLPTQFRRERMTLDDLDDDVEHGVRCAICLVRLEDGDVVGDIPCGHVFHKDCLKDWLKRKNRCPLCQQTGVARRQRRGVPISEENEQDESSSSHS